MNVYKSDLIEEHFQLVRRINELCSQIDCPYDETNLDDKCEYANKCVQLAGMKQYEQALYYRLQAVGIVIIDGRYFEQCTNHTFSTSMPNKGNDYDKDTETINKENNTAFSKVE